MEDKIRVMISYQGNAEELEKEFEGNANYLGQSSSIESVKFPLKKKNFEHYWKAWIIIYRQSW